MMSPGRGAFPVGQFEAQKRLPKGRGIPSFASSECPHDGEKVNGVTRGKSKPWFTRAAANVYHRSALGYQILHLDVQQ